jgi:hypothetical protein
MARSGTSQSLFAFLHGLATYEHRWAVLAIISLGLAIIVIDDAILNRVDPSLKKIYKLIYKNIF